MSNPETDPSPVTRAPVTLVRVEAFALRWPVATPVRTSFGTMHDRPAVLVRVEHADGAVGWGESWCNFPGCGAEHRVRLIETVVAPIATAQRFESPAALFETLSARTAVLAIQSGEPGPLAQAIAGVDLAVWDLLARRAGQPLWRYLGGTSDAIDVYASGINPEAPAEVVAARWAEGYRAFKLKIGFGEARDLANVAAVRASLPAGTPLMLDANQAWDLGTAQHMAAALAPFGPAWLEEPLRADRPWTAWRTLSSSTRVPLAGGENMIGGAAFEALIGSGAFGVVQPDVAKWGGISGLLPVIDRIHAAGLRWCPHFLGAGVGQLASAHLLAARGRSDGLLEIDANQNPLRTLLSPALGTIDAGVVRLGEAPGLGVKPDLARLRAACEARG